MNQLTPYLEKAVELLNKNLDKKIRIISNFDADGISAAAILTKALLRKGCDIHVSVIKQIRDGILEELQIEHDEFLLFSDLGSGQVDYIRKYNKPTIILDHHQPQSDYQNDDFVQVNPDLTDMEEDLISAAGIAYLFAETLDPRNIDLSAVVMVGALGDIQESDGRVTGLNEFILDKGVAAGAIKKSRGLRIFGRSTRPIHQALSYCTDPFIPGVSGDESGAVQFLSELDIPIKSEGSGFRTLDDLTKEEQQKLGTAIICERINTGEDQIENIFGDIYTLNLPDEFSNAKELATAINACGRMNNSAIGVQLLCGDKTAVVKARRVLNGYRRLLGSYISWVKKNMDSEFIITSENANFIIARDEIHEHMIGTITSIMARSDEMDSKPLFGLAHTEEGMVKISGRADGFGINLKEILKEACEKFGGEGGGHSQAAGGYIERGTEYEFAKVVDSLIKNVKESAKTEEEVKVSST